MFYTKKGAIKTFYRLINDLKQTIRHTRCYGYLLHQIVQCPLKLWSSDSSGLPKEKKLPIPFQNELYNKINEIGFNRWLPINGLLHSNVHKSANK